MAQLRTLNKKTQRWNGIYLYIAHVLCLLGGNFDRIKSEYDHFNGIIHSYSWLFMNIPLLKPETKNHMSNHRFLADIQPGAAPVMIITRGLNTDNIILNFTILLGSLYYHNSYTLISIKSPLCTITPILSPIFSCAICIMVQHQVRGG